MEIFLRRGDDTLADMMKNAIGELFEEWGPEPLTFSAEVAQAEWMTSVAQAGGGDEKKEDDEQLMGLLDTTPEEKEERERAKQTEKRKRAIEDALFLLYQSEVKARAVKTLGVLAQHAQRFNSGIMRRQAKINVMMSDFLMYVEITENQRDQMIAAAASVWKTESEKRRAMHNRALHKRYRGTGEATALGEREGSIVGERAARLNLTARQTMQLRNVAKALKGFLYETCHSRPNPRPIPSRQLPHYFSGDNEYWKLDATEGPYRMRRLLKKNFKGLC